MAARPQSHDLGQNVTRVVPMNWRSDGAKIKVQVSIFSGAILATVEFTNDDIRDPAVTPAWRPTAIAASAAATDATLDFCPRALRLTQGNAVGVARFSIVEAGGD